MEHLIIHPRYNQPPVGSIYRRLLPSSAHSVSVDFSTPIVSYRVDVYHNRGRCRVQIRLVSMTPLNETLPAVRLLPFLRADPYPPTIWIPIQKRTHQSSPVLQESSCCELLRRGHYAQMLL